MNIAWETLKTLKLNSHKNGVNGRKVSVVAGNRRN